MGCANALRRSAWRLVGALVAMTAVVSTVHGSATRREVEGALLERHEVLDRTETAIVGKIAQKKQTLAESLSRVAVHSAHRLRRWIDATDRLQVARNRIAVRRWVERCAQDLELLEQELAVVREARRELGASVVRLDAVLAQLTQMGALTAPVSSAKRLGRFGPVTGPRVPGVESSQRGFRWAATPGAPVRAVAAGDVVYSGRLSDGQSVVVMDHGDFRTVTTGLADVMVAQGQALRSADTVGHAGDAPLGLELRVEVGPESIAVDPEPWASNW